MKAAPLTEDAKSDSDYVERAENGQVNIPTSISSACADSLSESHREYLLQRHGTLDLDPIPSQSDADPYNWPTWKVFRRQKHGIVERAD